MHFKKTKQVLSKQCFLQDPILRDLQKKKEEAGVVSLLLPTPIHTYTPPSPCLKQSQQHSLERSWK
jgi:hypothetical protein